MTKGQVWPSLFQQKASFSWGQGLLWWWLYLLFLGNSDRNKGVTMQCIVWCALNLRGSARFHFRVQVWILSKCFDFFAENNIHGVIKSKRKGVWMYIVLITTKKTEAVRVLGPWSWSPTWCGPSISSLMIGISWLDGSLIVKLFKQRWQCFAAEQGAMSSVDFHLWHHYSVIVLRSLLFIIMALFGHKLCTYRSEESLEF